MEEKRHCCCCIPLPDGVMLVGIYGTAFHTGLLIIQLTHGASLAPDPQLLHPPFASDIVRLLLLTSHFLGMLVNLLLLLGMYWGKRKYMVPWLILQGFLAGILACLACYYITLFPLKNSCGSSSLEEKQSTIEGPLYYISSTRRQQEEDLRHQSGTTSSSCQPLLWYGAIMILSLLILFYYFYIVNEFLEQLKYEKKRVKTMWKIDIELKEDHPSSDELDENIEPKEDEVVVVLDETEPTTTTSSTTVKQVTFLTNESSSNASAEVITPKMKKTSRVVGWHDTVEIMDS